MYSKHLDRLKAAMEKGVEIPTVFGWYPIDNEKYHIKESGWLNLNPPDWDRAHTDKFKRGIKALGIEHKYPLPEEFK